METLQLQDSDSLPPPFGLHVYCTVTVKSSLYFLIFFNILFSVKNIYLKFYYFIKKEIFILRGILQISPLLIGMPQLLQIRG